MAQGQVIVLANGCFDLLHRGHIDHLREARRMGDVLLVGLTLDKFVNKPNRPIMQWQDRAYLLRELRCVSAVFPCENSVQAIMDFKPKIFVKGSDYKKIGLHQVEIEACLKVGAEIRFTTSPKQSTTDLIVRIRAG